MATKTRITILIVVYLLALLNIAAGIPKILQLPQELAFLSSIGLNKMSVSVLGLVQCAGGILLIWSRHRLTGAVLAGIALLISAIALLLGGNVAFGLISLLPILALVFVVWFEGRKARRTAE